MYPTLIALVVAGVLLAVKAHAFSSTPTLADAREWLAEARERLERELATRELATGLIFSLPAAVFLCTAGPSNKQYLSGVAARGVGVRLPRPGESAFDRGGGRGCGAMCGAADQPFRRN